MIKQVFFVFILIASVCTGQDHLRQGFYYLQRQQYQQALVHFDQVLTLYPDHLDAGLGTAQAFMGLARPGDAEKVLKGLLQKYPGNPRVQLGLGQACLALEDFESAANWLDRARQQLPPNPALDASLALACHNQGILAYQHGEKHRAVSLFKKSMALDSTNIKTHQNLAICYLELNDSRNAQEIVSRGLGSEPEQRELLLLKAQMSILDKKFADLVPIFTILHRNEPDNIAVGLRLAYFLRFQNRGAEATGVYRELAQRFPRNKEIIMEWAGHLMSGRDYPGARQLYDEFLTRYHDKPTIMAEIARTWLKEKNYSEA